MTAARSVAAAVVLACGALPAAASDLAATAAADTIRACLEAADRDPEAERACAGDQALACMDAGPEGQTTLGMIACFAAETDAWEAVIAGLEADILARAAAWGGEASDDGDRAAKVLRRAQAAWRAFRRADCAQAADIWQGGSMAGVAAAECALGHSAERAITLLARRRAFEAP